MKTITVSLDLHGVLREQRPELTNELIQRLRVANAAHYRNMYEPELRGRVDSLLDAFQRSVTSRPAVFANYLKSIAVSRISEGIALHEIQIILQILEDMIWCLVIDYLPQDKQIRGLSLVTIIIGAAKDQLAEVYLECLEKTELKAAHLQRRLDAMAKGTDSGPIDDQDLAGTGRSLPQTN